MVWTHQLGATYDPAPIEQNEIVCVDGFILLDESLGGRERDAGSHG